jgi:uncharacterized protein (DUF2147 family)
MNKSFKFLYFVLCVTASSAFANNNNAVIGQWQTIDDVTGKRKSIINIYDQDGKIYGKITRLFRYAGEDQDPICVKCKDERKNKKVMGMIVIKDLKKRGNQWSGGTILDPKNGKTYRCKIWLDEGKLKVRGYLGLFFRTQTWHKVKR